MIEIKRVRPNGTYHTHIVYEPGDIIPSEVRTVPYHRRRSAMRGEYVEDIHGRYVPLLRRICIDRVRKHDNMIFPGHTWQPWKHEMFSYPIDKAQVPAAPAGLKGRDILIAKLLEEGLEPELCVAKAYPRFTRAQTINYLRRIFQNTVFTRYLFEELGYMKKLRASLEAKGVTVDMIADNIVKIIGDNKEVPTLRKWALETALAALEADNKPNSIMAHIGPESDEDYVPEHLRALQKSNELEGKAEIIAASHYLPSAGPEL